MAYNEKLAGRIRECLSDIPNVEEKKMFRGMTFMVDGKMCVGVSGDDMMCRFDPSLNEEVLVKKGTRKMIMKGKEFKGYVYVSEEGLKSNKDFEYWIRLCLEFNKEAKASTKMKKK